MTIKENLFNCMKTETVQLYPEKEKIPWNDKTICPMSRVAEPKPPRAGVFGASRSRHFGPAPAPNLNFSLKIRKFKCTKNFIKKFTN